MQRIFTAEYETGARIEVLFHEEALPGECEADRIQVLLTSMDSERHGWLMTVNEAHDLRTGVDLAIERAQKYGLGLE